MFNAIKNRTRLGLEDLEGRELADAKPLGIVAAPLGTAAVSRTEATNPNVVRPASPSPLGAAIAPGSYVYTAFTIKNTTGGTVNFSISWGNGPAKNYSLPAGYEQTYYIGGLNQVATLHYDKSFAAGYQDQSYSLPGQNIVYPPGFYLVQPTPGLGAGKLYTFASVPNGVQLYS